MKDRTGNIAVVGTRDEVLPFHAVGAVTRIADSPGSARDAVMSLAASGFAVIIVSDMYLRHMEDLLEKYSSSATPCITAIPGRKGVSRFGQEYIRMLIKRAVGIDLQEFRDG